MIKITETIKNMMKNSEPVSNSKFVEEKLGEIDFDFAAGLTAEITEIDDELITVKFYSGNRVIKKLVLIKGEEVSFVPNTFDVVFRYTFFYK